MHHWNHYYSRTLVSNSWSCVPLAPCAFLKIERAPENLPRIILPTKRDRQQNSLFFPRLSGSLD